jgi:hypothetical protein
MPLRARPKRSGSLRNASGWGGKPPFRRKSSRPNTLGQHVNGVPVIMPAKPTVEGLSTLPETNRLPDARSDPVTPGGTSKPVSAASRTHVRLQVRVTPEMYAWAWRAAILERVHVGEIVERALRRWLRAGLRDWPAEYTCDLPPIKRSRRRPRPLAASFVSGSLSRKWP